MVTTPLHDFVHALASPAVQLRAMPADLFRIARGLLRRSSDHEIQDLVSDFIVRLLEAGRAGRAGSPLHLVGFDESELRAVVRHRMRQIIADRSPGRRQSKQIRDSVRLVLKTGLPVAPAAAPTTVMVNDKLSTPLVAVAVAYLATMEGAPGAIDANAVADRLGEMYFGRKTVHTGDSDPALSADDQYAARALAANLKTRLDPKMMDVLRARMRHDSLAEIAARENTAVSTIHARMQRAIAEVRAAVEAAGISRDVGEVALGVA